MPRNIFVLILALFLVFPASFLCADKIDASSKGFMIHPSSEWVALPPPFQGVVVSYAKKNTFATFHITVKDIEAGKTIDQLEWKDLFSPQFGSIHIHTQNTILLDGEKAKTCIYTLKPGEFKKTMEGKLPGKYINYVLVHGGKLFSITFTDTQDDFALNYPSFLTAIRTLRFDAPQATTSRRKPI